MTDLYTCLILPFPPTLNNLFINNPQTRGRFASKKYRTWQDEAARAIEMQRPFLAWQNMGVSVTYSFGRPDKRRRDVANYEKAISDALTRGGVLGDDAQIEHMTLRWDSDVVGCRVEIEEFPT